MRFWEPSRAGLPARLGRSLALPVSCDVRRLIEVKLMSPAIYDAQLADDFTADAIGLWRDGKLLVLEIGAHQFPNRCLKTDLPISGPHSLVEVRTQNVLPDELDLVRGLVIASTGQLLRIKENNKGNKVYAPLGVPLAPELQAKLKSNFGLILALSSIGLTIVLFTLTMILSFAGSDLAVIPLLGCLVGIIGIITGFMLLMSRTSGILSVARLADRKLWLTGVHLDWLARLPEYRISLDLLGRDYKRAVKYMWMAFGTSIVAGLAAIICTPFAVSGYQRGMASQDWPSVDGTIRSASISEHRSGRRRRVSFHVDFQFDYSVNGQQHAGENYENESTRAAAEMNLRNKPDGTLINVFYNPESPADHRLKRGLSGAEIGWIIASIITAGIALIALIPGFGHRGKASKFKLQIDQRAAQQPFGFQG